MATIYDIEIQLNAVIAQVHEFRARLNKADEEIKNLKQTVATILKGIGIEVEDDGTCTGTEDDYPARRG